MYRSSDSKPHSRYRRHPAPPHPRLLLEHVKYPSQSRYTLQWLVPPSAAVETAIPNNIDAAFKKATRQPKPSDLLLHGAAAVKCCERGTDLLRECASPPRSPVPFPVPTHSRDAAICKLRARTGRLVESEGQAAWDEDDVMLFLWGNSRLQKNVISRKLTKIIGVWSSGGKACLTDCTVCCKRW